MALPRTGGDFGRFRRWDVSRNPRFFRHSNFPLYDALDSLICRPFNSHLTVIDIKNFPFLGLIMERFGQKQQKGASRNFRGLGLHPPAGDHSGFPRSLVRSWGRSDARCS